MPNPARDRFSPPNVKNDGDFQGEFRGQEELEDFGEKGTQVEFQEKAHRFLQRVPKINEIGEREIIFTQVGGVFTLVTKLNGKLLSAVLTP